MTDYWIPAIGTVREEPCDTCGALNTITVGTPSACAQCGHRADTGRINCDCDACQYEAFAMDAPWNRSRAARIARGEER